jgi:hypothetical protein
MEDRDVRAETARRLTEQLDELLDHDTSELIVSREFARFRAFPVPDLVPLIVERRINERLRRHAWALRESTRPPAEGPSGADGARRRSDRSRRHPYIH